MYIYVRYIHLHVHVYVENRQNHQCLIMMQRLEANTQLERRYLKNYTLCSLLVYCFGLRTLKIA